MPPSSSTFRYSIPTPTYQNLAIHLLHNDPTSGMGGIEKYVKECSSYLFQHAECSSLCVYSIAAGKYAARLDGSKPIDLSAENCIQLITSLTSTIASLTIHHQFGWDQQVLNDVIDQIAPKASKINVVVHDFGLLCAQHNLLYNDSAFCGPPPSLHSGLCRTCRYGSGLESHRTRTAALLQKATTIVFPSQAAKDIFLRLFPDDAQRMQIIPHYLRTPLGANEQPLAPQARPCLVHLGSLLWQKGFAAFEEIATTLGPSFSYAIVGETGPGSFPVPVRHFPFNFQRQAKAELLKILRDLFPAYVLMLGRTPETFSFTMHETLEAGLPILTHQLSGNVAAVVQNDGCGKVFPDTYQLTEYLKSPREDLLTDIKKFAMNYRVVINEQGLRDLYGSPKSPNRV